MADPHGDFIWYELMTNDADAATRFYAAVIGWDVDDDPEYRHIKAGDEFVGGMLPLTPDMTAHGARPQWVAYVAVDDVDAMVSAIGERGGRTLMPARDMEGVGRFAMVSDPQGAVFYVMKPTPPADRPDARSNAFSPTRDGSCSWNELATSDQAAAEHFYSTLFGWVKSGSMPMGEQGDYDFISHHHVPIGAIMRAPEGQATGWTHVFRVSGIDAAAARVTASGGQVTMPPHEVPGDDWVIRAIDPQGASFALVGSK